MRRSCAISVFAMALAAKAAFAADVDAAKTAPEPAPLPAWIDAVTITGHVEGGITPDLSSPPDHLNWGHLFTDRSDAPLLNQAILTIQRPLDPKATGFDFGFKLQGMFGSDARYTHFLGELDYAIHSRHQLDVVEAHALAHLPILTEGGIDLKIGQFVTLEGAEVISAIDNPLYSHSYIFNFGIPFKHTGVLATLHATPWLDVIAGVTSGVNTSLGWPGDNNSSPSFHGGLNLTLLDGALTVIATTHIGPENPKQNDPLLIGWPFGAVGGTSFSCACDPNSALRYLNDVTVTWKATENLTFITDINYIRDDGWNLDALGRAHGVEAFGAAQYAIYKLSDWLKFAARLEVWRDRNGFFVASYQHPLEFVNLEHGFPTFNVLLTPGNPLVPVCTAAAIGGGCAAFGARTPGTTYLEVTGGFTITPEIPKNDFIAGLIIRPELRLDTSLSNTRPFAAGTKKSQVTFGTDIIVPFTLK